MKWRLVIPFCLILIFQTIFMMAFLSTGNVAQSLYQTELRSLKKDVENSGLLLEREVLQHWMNDIRSSVTIQTTIQSVLKEEGKKASDISHDWELNERIIGEIMPDVLELLHRSYGNSIYVVLDGPSAQRSAEGHQAGISVLDTDSSSFAADNSDLQLCRGAAVISKQFKVPLASDWKLDFDMSEETGSGFYNPYFLTKGQKLKGNIARFAFLGPISGALQADTDGVSYSIPLTAEDGTVIGVLGGTMLKEQIYSLLKNELLHKDEDAILMLAKRGENETVLTPVLAYGMSFHRSFEGMNGIGGTATRWRHSENTGSERRLVVSCIQGASGIWARFRVLQNELADRGAQASERDALLLSKASERPSFRLRFRHDPRDFVCPDVWNVLQPADPQADLPAALCGG